MPDGAYISLRDRDIHYVEKPATRPDVIAAQVTNGARG